MMMYLWPLAEMGLMVMKLIAHLQKGPTVTMGCNGVCGGESCLWGKKLTAAAMFDCLYAINKDGGPEIASA